MAEGFSKEEKEAMRARAAEARKARAKLKGPALAAANLEDCLESIASMEEPDRSLAEWVHATVLAAAPQLEPKTFYGMPAYAIEGKVICFFQNASKFKVRYSTLGFDNRAQLDDGTMWPTSWALLEANDANGKYITELVKKAVGR